MFSEKTIFFAALDWGLGHATRSVPVIRELEKQNKISLGITPLTKSVFEKEFPDIEKINIPAYNIRYSAILPLWVELILDAPRIRSVTKKEHELLEKIIDEKKIDVVISDSRFGLHSKKAHSVFITHQVFLKTPFANSFFQKQNCRYILNFDELWIPDYADEKLTLAGELSHGIHFHKNLKYIGPQSRLEKVDTQKKYDCLFLISGPEPQQSILYDKCIELAKKRPALKCALVAPRHKNQAHAAVDIFADPSREHLSELICSSEKIICRSGYSTLMDIHLLGAKNIVLIPTPGQTEQEYLAGFWKEKFGCQVVHQKNISTLKL